MLWRGRVVVVVVYGLTAHGSLLLSFNMEKCVTKLTIY
jgi:hypothetical protein